MQRQLGALLVGRAAAVAFAGVGTKGIGLANPANSADVFSAIGPTLVQDWMQLAARPLFGAAMRLVADTPLTESPVHNLIISNVCGPQTTLYFLGCEVGSMYPLGPLLGGAGLNITVMSLNGELGIGIISCPDLLPDLWDIADGFSDALKELLECSDEQPEGDDPDA